MRTLRGLKRFEKVALTLILVLTLSSFAVAIDKYFLGTRQTFTFAAADTTKSTTLGKAFAKSILLGYKVTMPNFSATTPTATFSIQDADSGTIYSLASIAESAAAYTALERPLDTNYTFTILLTTTAGTGGGVVTVDTWLLK